jgi:hypothetical protein
VLGGIFEGLSASVLFGVLTAMCMELPRGAFTRLGREHRGLGRAIERVRPQRDRRRRRGDDGRTEVVYGPAASSASAKLWAEGRRSTSCS